jgi:CubicO group peptidase (beta-lactamase class C family)
MFSFVKPRRLLSIPAILVIAACSAGRAPAPSAAEPGLTRALATADSLVQASVGKLTAGAVLAVSKDGHLVHNRAFGSAQIGIGVCEASSGKCTEVSPNRPMHTSTLFDLASVTKVMATTFAVMILVDEGKVDVDAPVYTYLPDFRGAHLDSITVRHLLQHSAGLVQWQPLYYQASNTAQTYEAIRKMPLQWGVGEGRHYSDLSFMLLGDIVEKVSGQRLDVFIENALYKPLGLRSTTFNPKQKGFKAFAATEDANGYEHHMVYDSTFAYKYRGDPKSWNGWRYGMIIGEVNDGNSFYANGGVAGHAGLFSTADELHVLLDLLLNHGTANGHVYIRPAVIDKFLTLDKYGHYLGWQYPAGLPEGSFSHTGFTGTYVLGVPHDRLSIVLLTNRQQMRTNEKGLFPNLAPLQLAVAKAIIEGADADAPRARF